MYKCKNCNHNQESKNNGFCLVCGDNIVEEKISNPIFENKVIIKEEKMELKPVKSKKLKNSKNK